ncbi:universal stress protein [Brumicola nitratireducens]|uniref:Universal stress protein family n=1 Tax=Glaciecola nitratireducens (strain JCM 12485 / KCTC 12276 / FR1064) TaxID=1085623 RepID=G4QLM4_GLANF|nr:universal stress protein [Glaciecola nitratireducens]AEP30130.1 universal stress protein family [Glaciecola nitratireducens FR1064]
MTKIITCVDGSAMTTAVTNAAIWASNKLTKPILFLHTIEKEQQHGADNYSGAIGLGARSALLQEMTKLDEQRGKLALKLGKELLERVASQAQTSVVQQVESTQRHGELADAIVDMEDKTRLIVIGRSGKGHEDDYSALGSNIETLLRKATHPVVIIPDTFSEPTSFMVAYDGRQTADNALQRVIDGGLLHGLHCHLVSVKNNEPDLKEKFLAAQKKLEEKGFTVTSSFVEGNIFDALMEYKQKHDIGLIVMGAFGHSKLRQFFLGSNTMKMLERSKVPMVVLR